jgi:HTH domain
VTQWARRPSSAAASAEPSMNLHMSITDEPVAAKARHYAPVMVTARHPLLRALDPVADALGAELVGPKHVRAGDIPLAWDGEIVGGLRLPGMQGSLERMMGAVEQELGASFAAMSREHKQLAVRMLDDRGAFALRRSVESVADAMGVSRFTIYNYLNASG